jgi:hypothetical protein
MKYRYRILNHESNFWAILELCPSVFYREIHDLEFKFDRSRIRMKLSRIFWILVHEIKKVPKYHVSCYEPHHFGEAGTVARCSHANFYYRYTLSSAMPHSAEPWSSAMPHCAWPWSSAMSHSPGLNCIALDKLVKIWTRAVLLKESVY